jgi:hypothetical protein
VTLSNVQSMQHSPAELTPGQALSLLSHCERRLMRRTRSYYAARARLAAAREEFAQVERLAGEARVYRPVAA